MKSILFFQVKVIAPLPVIELYCEEQKFSELNQNKKQDSSNDKSDNIDDKHDGETEGSGEGRDGWGRVENLVLFRHRIIKQRKIMF